MISIEITSEKTLKVFKTFRVLHLPSTNSTSAAPAAYSTCWADRPLQDRNIFSPTCQCSTASVHPFFVSFAVVQLHRSCARLVEHRRHGNNPARGGSHTASAGGRASRHGFVERLCLFCVIYTNDARVGIRVHARGLGYLFFLFRICTLIFIQSFERQYGRVER